MANVGFAGVPIRQITRDNIVTEILESSSSSPQTFRLVNAGTFYEATRNRTYWTLLLDGGTNLPDGAPLAHFVKRTSGRGVADQIRGPWLFETCMNMGRSYGTRHYLLGSTDRTIRLLMAQLIERYPGVSFVGHESPPFRTLSQEELAAQDERIRVARPDIVWVALGTPKQDAEARRITDAIGTTTVAVGAAFDFSAGTVAEAPVLIRRLGLEWLFRLANEPRRLWRRYLIGNFVFVGLWAKEIIGARR